MVKFDMSQQWQDRKAPLMPRCIAFIIDGFLSFIPCYFCLKDGIREGRSLGKGIMGLRVVDYNTGSPATMMQSCLRNCCNLCVCLACIGEGRHIGDYIGGTIVISDQ